MSLADSAETETETPLRRALILATLTTATALYAMAITIANVALPQMQGSLSATQDQISWVVTLNLVATAVATPMTGWLAGRFGQRMVMIGGVFGFTVCSLLCGVATSLEQVVLYRIGQGVFGAPLVPLSQAIVLQVFPKRQHGTVIAIFGMGVVLGPIIAPTIGGYLAETYNWRWVFFMIVPFGLFSFAGVWAFIRDRHDRQDTRLDWTGFIALSLAIASLQLMLDRGERNDWLDSTEILLYAVLAALSFYIFVVHSLTASNPFLRPRLLLDRNFSLGLFFALVFGMLNFTPMVLIPPLLQDLRGYPDTLVGLLLATRGAGTLAGFILNSYINRLLDPRWVLGAGFLTQAIAGFAMADFGINVTTWEVAWTSTLQGFGVGLIWVPLTLITFATLAPRYMAEGTAVFHLLRNIGSSIFISASVAVVVRSTEVNYANLIQNISPFNEVLAYPWVSGLYGTDSLRELAALSREITRQAAMIGYVNAFDLFAWTAVAVLPFLLLVRWRRTPAHPAGG